MSADMTQLIRETLEKTGDVRTAFRKALASGAEKTLPFSTVEEYRAVTGKRFRMTREQMARNISRDQAFQEFKDSLLNG